MVIPDAVVHHVGSASSGGQHSDFSVYHGHRNLIWTFFKNMPGALFWILLPMHLLLNIAVGGEWGGQKGIDPAAFPARMEVDYVRVYQQAPGAKK